MHYTRYYLIVLIFTFFSTAHSTTLYNNTTSNNILLNTNYIFNECKNDKRVLNISNVSDPTLNYYLFYTKDILPDLVAYSGKPLEIMILMDEKGLLYDLKLIKHSEPILLTGIPIEKLIEATAFYKGKNIKYKINIGEDNSSTLGIPIIAGATVTSLILHQTIVESSIKVAKNLNVIENKSSYKCGNFSNFIKYSWEELIKKNLLIKGYYEDNYGKSLDIYFADIKHPSIGINILGEQYYRELISDFSDEESAIIILNNGSYSFKGSGFARGGIFDRFRIEQNNNIYTFKDNDFRPVYDLNDESPYNFEESGIFIVKNKEYCPCKPWQLALTINYKTIYFNYSLPKSLFNKENTSYISKIWIEKKVGIVLYILLWIFTIIIFCFRNTLSKNSFYLSVIYNFVLITDIYIVIELTKGQPSIVNILSILDNFMSIKNFIIDPYLFIGWILTILTTLFWGKAFFCGWICPFGSLQELIFKLRSLIIKNDISIEFNKKSMRIIANFRYFVLVVLLITCFYKLEYAELLASIEPFKTFWIVGIANSSLKIILYSFSLIIISIFTYRFFCRILCPLGALLSLLSIFNIYKINRRKTCNVCKICEKTCNSLAIKNGKIDSTECFGCFTCINNMYNTNLCPPLLKKKIKLKYEN